MGFIVRFRTDTPERWFEVNPILRRNEVAREDPSGKFKVGDAKTRYCDLPYATTLPRDAVMPGREKAR